jgi:Tfp pilus assembly PilM family ATPase
MFTKIVAFLFAPVARLLAGNEVFIKAVLSRVNVTAVADALAARVVDEVDHDEIAKRTAQLVSPSDVASHFDAEAIAAEVEIDYYEVAGRLESSDVAEHIDLSDLARECEIEADEVTVDYEELAKALLREFAKPKVEVRASNG